MRYDTQPFTFGSAPPAATLAPNATGASNPIDSERLRERTIQILNPAGAGTFSLDIEGTIDGSTWAKIQTGITTLILVTVTPAVKNTRINVTAAAGGATPTAVLGGFDSRTDGG